VTAIEPGYSFVWETTAAGVTPSGAHFVEGNSQHSVITLVLRQHGALTRLVDALTGRLARTYLSMEMEGFRRTAEGNHTR
jgi:hypothetical protein